jgi:hypothetical protein
MMRRRRTTALVGAAMTVVCLTALAVPAVAAKPGMTVKIPARQDVDNVYVLAAIHQKKCTMQVTGSVMGHRFRTFRKSKITIHLTNQGFLRLSSSAKKSVKKAIRRGKTVKAKITVTARNSSGERNSVTRSVTLKD